MATIVSSSGDTATMICCSIPTDDPFTAPDEAVKNLFNAIAEAKVETVSKVESCFSQLVNGEGKFKEGTQPYFIQVWKAIHCCRGQLSQGGTVTILEAIHHRFTVLQKESVEQARELYIRLLSYFIKQGNNELPVETITRVSVTPLIEVRSKSTTKYPLQRGTILHMAASTHHHPILTLVRDAVTKTESVLHKASHDNIEEVDLTVQTEPVVRVNARIAARFLWLQMLYSRTYESGCTAFFLCNDKDGLRLLYQEADKERGKFLRYLDVDPVYKMYITQRRERLMEGSLDRKSSLEDITTEGRNIDPESGIVAIEGFFRYVQNTPLIDVPTRDGVIPNNGNEVLGNLPSGSLMVD